jgi:hypothetical protein
MDSPIFAQAEALIQIGKISEARALLEDLVFHEPKNDQAWVLLSDVVGHRNEVVDCLHQALAANPNNSAARQRLDELVPPSAPLPPKQDLTKIPPDLSLPELNVEPDLKSSAVLQPDKLHLLELVRQDPTNDAAWLKLADQAESSQDEAEYLRHAIAANPYNTIAKLRLKKINDHIPT